MSAVAEFPGQALEPILIDFEAGPLVLETDNGQIAKVCCRAVTAATGRSHTITAGISHKFAVREIVSTLSQRSPMRAV